MRWREFLGVVSAAAVAGPLAARAQQAERMRRIGVLMARVAGDPAMRDRLAAFLRTLHELDWVDGRNVQIDSRGMPGNNTEMMRTNRLPRRSKAKS
jgi:putative ABC transport system substrate-binding protein